MIITRRKFLASLVLVPFIDWNKPIRFKLEIDPYLFGIPYHQSNGTTSEWLGFSRITGIMDNIQIPKGY